MYAVILAAGRGTRMGELSENMSKTMVPIAGKPKLAYTIDQLPEEVTDVVIVIGYLSNTIREYFGDIYKDKNIYYVEQAKLNGTDGALRVCEEVLQGQEKFLVLNGDDLYIKKDLERMLRYSWAVLAYYSYDAKKFGIIAVDENDNFEEIWEKSDKHSEGLIQCGAFMVGKEYFDSKPIAISDTEYGLPHTLLNLYEKHPMRVVHTDFWQPVGTPEQLKQAEKNIKEFL